MTNLADLRARLDLMRRAPASQLTVAGLPNISPEWLALRDLDAIRFNVKQTGYALGRALAAALPPIGETRPSAQLLASKPATQADIEADWAAHWIRELGVTRVYDRRLWRQIYVLQSLHASGALRDGARGLGVSCRPATIERLARYLANRGTDVVAALPCAPTGDAGDIYGNTPGRAIDPPQGNADPDADPATAAPSPVCRVDLDDIPANLRDFDFCWSVCALEHLGSIRQGLDFIEHALATLKPGGIAVHTTEFNYANDTQTIDNWPTVLFQRRHFEEIASRLQAKGHHVQPLDFDTGALPMDRFIDVPPYYGELTANGNDFWTACHRSGEPLSQLKIAIDGFPSTWFGITIRRGH
jgi:SAM-dependent methyltransferase